MLCKVSDIDIIWNDRHNIEKHIQSQISEFIIELGDHLKCKLYLTYLIQNIENINCRDTDFLSYAYYYSQHQMSTDAKFMTFHNTILKAFKGISPIYDGYSIFSYGIINDTNNVKTLQLIDTLIQHNFIPTLKDINMIGCIKYKHTINRMVKYKDFFTCNNLINDIKSVICYYLLHILLYTSDPLFTITASNIINAYP